VQELDPRCGAAFDREPLRLRPLFRPNNWDQETLGLVCKSSGFSTACS
jgi:hypothetical protein